VSQANVASGRIRVERVQTVFGLFRALHAGTALAYAAHAAAAIVALGGLVRVALRRPEPSALLAMTVATTLLLPAYVMDYDLVCLVVPMAWVAAEASRSGWLGWEKTALAAAFVAPEACWLLGAFVHVPLGLVPMWGLWAVVYTRSQLPAAQLPQRSATQRERDSREGASPHARRTLEFLRAHALYSLSLFRVGARRVTLKGCLSFVSRAGAAASVVVSVQGER
jgi:hypothetical protein